MTLTPLVLVDARIYMDGADLTGYSNMLKMAAKAAQLKRTTFADGGANTYKAGLFDGQADFDGLWQAGDLSMPDDSFWANFGASAVPLTAVPTGGNVGDTMYLTRGVLTDYKFGAKVGELLGTSASLKTSWPDVRGKILHPQGTARTSSGNGTGVQLGALSSSQAMYFCLHVMSISGTSTPTITVAIQDSVDNTFTSPHTSGTFAAATVLGGQTLKVSGAVTNTWYRATWTITGSTPSFLFAVSAGIGPK